jgi:hypothetical protein
MRGNSMDSKTIQSISKKIYRRFPEVDGVKPSLRKQKIPGTKRDKPSNLENHNYLLTFKNTVKGPGSQKIQRIIRVVTSSSGKIIKTTTSK